MLALKTPFSRETIFFQAKGNVFHAKEHFSDKEAFFRRRWTQDGLDHGKGKKFQRTVDVFLILPN